MRLIAFALLAACSSSPDGEASSAAPAADGARTYAMACARCHGARGQGDGDRVALIGPVPKLNRAMPRAYVVEIVTRGKGAMPPHADRLSSADIEAVSDHVLSFTP